MYPTKHANTNTVKCAKNAAGAYAPTIANKTAAIPKPSTRYSLASARRGYRVHVRLFRGGCCNRCCGFGGRRGRQFGCGCWPCDRAFFNHRQTANRIIFHIDVDDAIFGFAQFFGEAKQVRGVERRDCFADARSQIGITHNRDPMPHDGFPAGRSIRSYRLARLPYRRSRFRLSCFSPCLEQYLRDIDAELPEDYSDLIK